MSSRVHWSTGELFLL